MNGWKGSKKYRLHPAYDVVDLFQIFAMGTEINRIANPKCHLYCWTTKDFLEESLEMLKKWGWTMKQIIPWKDDFGSCRTPPFRLMSTVALLRAAVSVDDA